MKTLSEITPADRPLIGGKAWNCAVLKQAGFPVPDGLAVPAHTTEAEIAAIDGHAWLATVPADATFAVRSSGIDEDSAGHSFAGVHETALNVPRRDVPRAVLTCRRSAGSEQAQAYRTQRRLEPGDGAIGVLVQRMVPADVSGVAFTINPVGGADDILVNATLGLGEALVSGRLVPDEFTIRKADNCVVASTLAGEMPTLSERQLAELASLLKRIEQHYGSPQDVEWCYADGRFWILQSRPVTAVASAGREIEWTRANLIEVLPEQLSPQALASFEEMLNAAERRYMGRLMAPESELGPIMKAFHGRMYMNLSQLRHVCRVGGAAPAAMLRSLGHPERIRPEDEIRRRPPLGELIRCLPDFVRLAVMDARAETLLRRHEARSRQAVEALEAADPSSATDMEIWQRLDWWRTSGPDVLQIVFVMSNVMFRENQIRDVCERVGFPYERLVYPQLAAGERSVSTQQAVDLVALGDVARHDSRVLQYLRDDDGTFVDFRHALAGTVFLERFDAFLAIYGHRGRYESDWAIPRLREDPAPALFAVRGQLSAPHGLDRAAVATHQDAEAAAAWRDFEARLTRWQRWTQLPRVRSLVRRLKKQYVWREQVRSDLTRVLAAMRRWHLALAGRFVERGWIDRRDDYFLLRLDEVHAAIRAPQTAGTLRTIAAERARILADERTLAMPMLMRESDLPALLRRRPIDAVQTSDVLVGLCVSTGRVEGPVVVMRDPQEFASMIAGAILVAPATDPSWTPLFTLASGIIVEVGGMLSHASTIAREYGLPALANVKDATRVLKTGDRVRLDATAGRVTVVARGT